MSNAKQLIREVAKLFKPTEAELRAAGPPKKEKSQ